MAVLTRFEYFAPSNLTEASSLLAEYGGNAEILAGGTDVLPSMKRRKRTPKYLINIKKIPGLDYINYNPEEGLRIGALTTIRTVEKSKDIQKNYTLIYESACIFATPQVRNMATVGGNVCRASSSADMTLPLLTLGSVVKIACPNGERKLPLDEFFVGPGESVLKFGEILTEIHIPSLPKKTGTAFLKIKRTSEDLAQFNAAGVLTINDNRCEEVRIGLGAVAPHASIIV